MTKNPKPDNITRLLEHGENLKAQIRVLEARADIARILLKQTLHLLNTKTFSALLRLTRDLDEWFGYEKQKTKTRSI